MSNTFEGDLLFDMYWQNACAPRRLATTTENSELGLPEGHSLSFLSFSLPLILFLRDTFSLAAYLVSSSLYDTHSLSRSFLWLSPSPKGLFSRPSPGLLSFSHTTNSYEQLHPHVCGTSHFFFLRDRRGGGIEGGLRTERRAFNF